MWGWSPWQPITGPWQITMTTRSGFRVLPLLTDSPLTVAQVYHFLNEALFHNFQFNSAMSIDAVLVFHKQESIYNCVPSCVMQMEPQPIPTLRASTPASMRFLAWAAVTTVKKSKCASRSALSPSMWTAAAPVSTQCYFCQTHHFLPPPAALNVSVWYNWSYWFGTPSCLVKSPRNVNIVVVGDRKEQQFLQKTLGEC